MCYVIGWLDESKNIDESIQVMPTGTEVNYIAALNLVREVIDSGLFKSAGICITEYLGDKPVESLIFYKSSNGEEHRDINEYILTSISNGEVKTPEDLMYEYDFNIDEVMEHKYVRCLCCGLYYIEKYDTEKCPSCKKLVKLGIQEDKIIYSNLWLDDYL